MPPTMPVDKPLQSAPAQADPFDIITTSQKIRVYTDVILDTLQHSFLT